MRVVNFSSEIIRNDRLPYVLDDKVQPVFFNAGNVVVNIEGIPIPPNSSFQAGVDGAISMGSVDVTFENEAVNPIEGSQRKVVCFYGKLISENQSDSKKGNCN